VKGATNRESATVVLSRCLAPFALFPLPFSLWQAMRRLFLVVSLLAPGVLAAQGDAFTARYRADADRIIAAAVADSAAWKRLAEMTDRFGNRLSGSDALERTIDWVVTEMKRDGLQKVHTEPVMVPHWVRGKESAELVEPRRAPLYMIGLGGSIATPAAGITAPVIVVSSFDELHQRAADVKGKIVLYDEPFVDYGQTVAYRGTGAIEAAKLGAVASLIASVSSYSIRNPHTGAMRYDSAVTRIPAAALSVEDAHMLHRMQGRGDRVVVTLKMEAKTLPDAPSRNVMGEITGRERPDEVVVMGGHIDSWDVGQGAMDDGGGVVAAWEALRVLQRLGLKPRRTIRVVGWTNEENGSRGGNAYRDAHRAEIEKHQLALESDGGVFKPTGFSFGGTDSATALVQRIASLLDPIGAGKINRGGGGADVTPLMLAGVPGGELEVDGTRYFWFHHSSGDTMDVIDPHEMALCVATMAVMAYVAAEMPESIPHGVGR
jgi:carboxypeptidase Q